MKITPPSRRTSATPGCGTGCSSRSSPTRTACSAGARRRSNGTRGPSSARSRTSPSCVVGEDPTRVEHLWQMMYRQHFWHGHGIVRATAIAGIDLALWDILGKVAGLPCSEALGRAGARPRPHYCHLGGGRMEDFYETAAEDAAAVRRPRPAGRGRRLHGVQGDGRAADDAARGARSRSAPPSACVAAMREAVGDESTSWSIATPGRRRRWACSSPRRSSRTACTSSKSRAGRRASTGWRRSTRAVATPIATGERVTNLRGVPRPVRARACEVCQLDITHCGGLTRGPADRGAGRGAPHRAGPAQSAGAGQHRGVAGVRLLAAELHHLRDGHADVPWRQDVVGEGFTVEREGRIVRPNTRPGLGIAIDETRCASTRSSRRCRASSTGTAAWATGERPLPRAAARSRGTAPRSAHSSAPARCGPRARTPSSASAGVGPSPRRSYATSTRCHCSTALDPGHQAPSLRRRAVASASTAPSSVTATT